MEDYSNHFFFYSGAFSNWHPSLFFIDGQRYTCVEQYMMSRKAELFEDYDVLEKILDAFTPKEHQTLGRLVKGFDRKIWDSKKTEIVFRGNLAKFSQDSNLRDRLLDTGDCFLVEANPKDVIWGIGHSEREARQMPSNQWRGQNLMGKVLMRVRESIKSPTLAP